MKMPVLFWLGMGRVVFQYIPCGILFSERQERKLWIRGKICGKKEKRERENKEKMHLGNTVTLLTTRIDFVVVVVVCYLLAFCFLTL